MSDQNIFFELKLVKMSAKECVTTHLPNQLALKMDAAGAWSLYRAAAAIRAKLAGQYISLTEKLNGGV